MQIHLPEKNNIPRQQLHPHLLHSMVKNHYENGARSKRGLAYALLGVAVVGSFLWYKWQTLPMPTNPEKNGGGGVPELVYPDKPKSPIAATKPAPIPKPKAPAKSEGQKWGESALPTDAETKTEGVSISEFQANKKKIAEMERQLENAKRQVMTKEVAPAPAEKSLSELENESEAAIKAEREGKTPKQPKEKEGGFRWGVLVLFALLGVAVVWLIQSAKHDSRINDLMDFNVPDKH